MVDSHASLVRVTCTRMKLNLEELNSSSFIFHGQLKRSAKALTVLKGDRNYGDKPSPFNVQYLVLDLSTLFWIVVIALTLEKLTNTLLHEKWKTGLYTYVALRLYHGNDLATINNNNNHFKFLTLVICIDQKPWRS